MDVTGSKLKVLPKSKSQPDISGSFVAIEILITVVKPNALSYEAPCASSILGPFGPHMWCLVASKASHDITSKLLSEHFYSYKAEDIGCVYKIGGF